MKRPIAIVLAGVGAGRFPALVLEDLAGAPLLARVIERLRAARTLGGIAVATTGRGEDKPLRFLAQVMHVGCFVGSDWDVLARLAGAAEQLEADPVVCVSATCPFVDPQLVDLCVSSQRSRAGIAHVGLGGEFPAGLAVEVLAARALRRAHLEAGPAAERADATAFVRAHPERFPSLSVPFPGSVSAAGRWTVDDPADLDFARAVYARLYRPGAPPFGWREVHDLLAREPGLGNEASALGRPISRPE